MERERSPEQLEEERLREEHTRNYEKYFRKCEPFTAFREWYKMPEVTKEELELERQADMQEVLDSFWLNDKE